MDQINTLREQASIMRELARSFQTPTIKADLLALAERCDRRAETLHHRDDTPAKASPSA